MSGAGDDRRGPAANALHGQRLGAGHVPYAQLLAGLDQRGDGGVGVGRAGLGSGGITLGELAGRDEIYLPWGPDYDLWRERHLLRKPAHTITKAHSLAPVLRAPETWALVPSFMAADLTARTGCRAAPLAENPPERAVYWVERRRRRAANNAALHVLEDALTDLF
ncbi:hypothetical protein [Nonomuraea sp. NPDC049158]|uniref:hypothetical protein n=1 Tax=Nonomuraea sp. NPDC049158 TaxID=3155649 RepID=UPI003409624A